MATDVFRPGNIRPQEGTERTGSADTILTSSEPDSVERLASLWELSGGEVAEGLITYSRRSMVIILDALAEAAVQAERVHETRFHGSMHHVIPSYLLELAARTATTPQYRVQFVISTRGEDDYGQDELTPNVSRQPLSRDDRALMRRASRAVQSREIRTVFEDDD
jgi:hypothetical protein